MIHLDSDLSVESPLSAEGAQFRVHAPHGQKDGKRAAEWELSVYAVGDARERRVAEISSRELRFVRVGMRSRPDSPRAVAPDHNVLLNREYEVHGINTTHSLTTTPTAYRNFASAT